MATVSSNTNGVLQRGWCNRVGKIHRDSVFHADGTLAEPPIALCEVQGYVYAAKRAAALLARAVDEPDLAKKLDSEAEVLRAKFEEAFWCDELGTYALALDGKKQQCRVRTSNAGHPLFCKIASQERAEAVAASLMARECFSGWGVRTVGASESRYNPMSYHNGSVWPHDNALIGLGFSLYGMQERACEILDGLFEASRYVELQRLPELFCGFHKRPESSGPTLYPVACSPQAWAAGSVFLLLQACLGLEAHDRQRQVYLANPRLPVSLDELRIQNFRLGDAVADFLIRRHGSEVAVHVLRKSGDIDIIKSA